MDDPKISVTLTGPAKIGGKHEPPGKTVTVSHTLAFQLAASGVINPETAEALAAAVSKVAEDPPPYLAERLAETEELLTEANATVEKLIADLKAEATARASAENDLRAASEALAQQANTVNAANTDIANLTASLTAEVNARVEAEEQLAVATTRIAELEETITSRAIAAEEAAEEATNSQKAGKKPTAAKD